MSICLNADAIRDELLDGAPGLTVEQVALIRALPDDEIDTAIRETVTDSFWYEFDAARSDAIRYLVGRLPSQP